MVTIENGLVGNSLRMNNLPMACNLTGAELQERRRTILEKLRDAVVESERARRWL